MAAADTVLPLLGPRLASIVISVILILLLFVAMHKARARHARNLAAILIACLAVFGIDGPALANHYVAGLQSALADLLSGAAKAVSGAAGNASAWDTLYLLAIIIIAGVAVYFFWKLRTPLVLLMLMVLALPLMAYPDFQGLSLSYVSHVGAPLYNGIAAFFNAL